LAEALRNLKVQGMQTSRPIKHFQTEDGWVLMGSPNDKLFRKMCDALGKPEWKEDPRFLTNGERVKHKPELVGMISTIHADATNRLLGRLVIGDRCASCPNQQDGRGIRGSAGQASEPGLLR